MTASHTQVPKPSSLLALLCLALVHRLRPAWTAVTLRDAAALEGFGPERLARLASRALPAFEQTVALLTRRGRPPEEEAAAAAAEHALTAELLAVATALLQKMSGRMGAEARALILGALLRLRATYPQLKIERFAAALAIPTRTLRAWRTAPPATPLPRPSSPPPPKRKRVRRGRFAFDVLLPDTQIAADTTDLSAFGVPLKLIAAQDVGGRDQDLFAAVIVDDHENAELVSQVLASALAGSPGAQAITDQGTPYMAAATAAALEALDVEHAPQPEGAPTKKATIERAFSTLKSIAAPLLAITDRLAVAVPALHSVELARTVTTVVLTALLRAYQAGARAAGRADRERGGVDAEALARAAARSREQARARDQSVRLLLEHIHAAYGMDVPLEAFRRRFRGFPLEVLHEAERAFARQAHRGDIQSRIGYFAFLVRTSNDSHRKRRAREDVGAQRRAELAAAERDDAQRREHWRGQPGEWLAHGLEVIAASWLPEAGKLVAGGIGAGTAHVRGALARLLEMGGAVTAADTAAGVAAGFARAWRPKIGDKGVTAVLETYWAQVRPLCNANSPASARNELAQKFAAAILHRTGPPRHPAPFGSLRN